jgi:hypothetical protein
VEPTRRSVVRFSHNGRRDAKFFEKAVMEAAAAAVDFIESQGINAASSDPMVGGSQVSTIARRSRSIMSPSLAYYQESSVKMLQLARASPVSAVTKYFPWSAMMPDMEHKATTLAPTSTTCTHGCVHRLM